MTNLFAHQYIKYCDTTGIEGETSYTNPITDGSLASPPPTATISSSSSSTNSESTSASSSSASASTTLQSNSTVQNHQSSPSLSAGAIAGIAVGSFVSGFGALALCFVLLLLPWLKKRKTRENHHPRGTLGGAVLPSSWIGHGGNPEDTKRHPEQKAFLGSASAGTTPGGAGARDYSGPHTPDAPMEERTTPWNPSSYSKIQRRSEMDDTSFTAPSPELDSRPISEPSSPSAYRISQLGSPYKTTPGSRNPREAPDMLNYGKAPMALRTQGYASGGTLSSSSSGAAPAQAALSQQTPSRTFQSTSNQSQASLIRPQQRPETGFVSPITSSPPTSTAFQPTPPSVQGPFNNNEPQLQSQPQTLGLGLTRAQTPRDQSVSRPVSSTTQPSFTISPPEEEQVQQEELALPPSLQAPTARTPSPSQASNRYLYENAALTSHPVTSSPTFISNATSPRPVAGPSQSQVQVGEGWPFPDTAGQRDGHSGPVAGIGTSAGGTPSSNAVSGSTGAETAGSNEGPSARGPWEGYVTAENALRDGIWEVGSRDNSPRRE